MQQVLTPRCILKKYTETGASEVSRVRGDGGGCDQVPMPHTLIMPRTNGDVARGVFDLLGGGGDGVEADVGEEQQRGAVEDAARAERRKAVR